VAETAATFEGSGVEWREMCVRLDRPVVLQGRAENLRATCFVIQNCALSVCFCVILTVNSIKWFASEHRNCVFTVRYELNI
jgi:hypothetical protein